MIESEEMFKELRSTEAVVFEIPDQRVRICSGASRSDLQNEATAGLRDRW